MTAAKYSSVLSLYREILNARAVKRLLDEKGLIDTGRIYSFGFVLWLMISQRLEAPGTTAHVIGRATTGAFGRLLPQRWRKHMSCATGGYCRARQRMPKVFMKTVAEYLAAELGKRLHQVEPSINRPVHLLDGSSVQLAHEEELIGPYPPAQNQHGKSHWPVIRVVAMHEARSGLASGLSWGPMYGPAAVGEQALAKRLIAELVAGAVLIGDRNFGIFAIAFEAACQGCETVLRLTKARAEKIGGQRLKAGMDLTVIWKASDWDRQHQQLPAAAEVRGRLVVCEMAGFREPLYLFTTLSEPPDEMLRLYGLRWNIESDLRSLKQTARLHRLTVKSEDMVEKELWAALMTYNLVRTIVCLAAMQIRAHPRDLSFTRVLYLVDGFLPYLLAEANSRTARREVRRLLELAAQCKLPKRKNQRSYPRAVWPTPHRFPLRKQKQVEAGK